jgi:hypothetical protein
MRQACKVCRRKFKNEPAYQDHLSSEAHRDKIEEIKQSQNQAKLSPVPAQPKNPR